MFKNMLRHRSGRVIALGRSMLAAIFLFAIWVDSSQPAQGPAETYALLAAYLGLALLFTAVTWDNWWLEAKLAAPVHILDVFVFTLLMLGTDGYTSPFFLFFVFLILAAAIRWGWRETAATAIGLTLLYLAAGTFASAGNTEFELQRFIIRGGHLVILSAILIWFGVNHGFTGTSIRRDRLLPEPSLTSPFESALEGARQASAAQGGLLLWRGAKGDYLQVVDHAGLLSATAAPSSGRMNWGTTPFLFDIERDRAFAHRGDRRARFFAASEAIEKELATDAGIVSGLALPLQTDTGSGIMLLGGIAGLTTDHIEFGQHLADAVASHIERHALLSAVEQNAVSSARLALSRDLHDSIVQFLAGATFRVEAISRAARSGGETEQDLAELKTLLLQEQQELRSAIGAMRADDVALSELARDLEALCTRLARQWNIGCSFSASVPKERAPMRLHLDTHQLVREAVANAVRHAGAESVRVALSTEASNLLLEIINDGRPGERLPKGAPWSLRERVEDANGTLMLTSRGGTTTVSVSLPMEGDAAA